MPSLNGITRTAADVVELVDMPDLGSGAARRAGSIPVIRTKASQKWGAFFMTGIEVYPELVEGIPVIRTIRLRLVQANFKDSTYKSWVFFYGIIL